MDHLFGRYVKRNTFSFRKKRPKPLEWLTSILFSPGKSCLSLTKSQRDYLKKLRQSGESFGLLEIKDGRGYLFPLEPWLVGFDVLQIYNAQNRWAKIFKKLLQTGLRLRIAQPLLSKVELFVNMNGLEKDIREISLLDHIKKALGRKDLKFSISLGTPGPHRKPVIQVITRDGQTLGYVKAGWNEETNALVENESKILQQLAACSFDTFVTPNVLYKGWWQNRFLCIAAGPECDTKSAPKTMTVQYTDVVKEFWAFNSRRVALKETAFWANLLEKIEGIEIAYYRHLLQEGAHRIEKSLGSHHPLPFHLSHGDFAPWNARSLNNRLYLFDWEYANMEAPPGWDLFHFSIQTLLLIKKLSTTKISKALQENEIGTPAITDYLENIGAGKEAYKPLFLLYLIERLAFYVSEERATFQKNQDFAALFGLFILEIKSLE